MKATAIDPTSNRESTLALILDMTAAERANFARLHTLLEQQEDALRDSHFRQLVDAGYTAEEADAATAPDWYASPKGLLDVPEVDVALHRYVDAHVVLAAANSDLDHFIPGDEERGTDYAKLEKRAEEAGEAVTLARADLDGILRHISLRFRRM